MKHILQKISSATYFSPARGECSLFFIFCNIPFHLQYSNFPKFLCLYQFYILYFTLICAVHPFQALDIISNLVPCCCSYLRHSSLFLTVSPNLTFLLSSFKISH